MSGERISTPADAAALIWAVLPKEEIIVAHNHPSGNLTPSKADLAATRELKALSERLGFRRRWQRGRRTSASALPLHETAPDIPDAMYCMKRIILLSLIGAATAAHTRPAVVIGPHEAVQKEFVLDPISRTYIDIHFARDGETESYIEMRYSRRLDK